MSCLATPSGSTHLTAATLATDRRCRSKAPSRVAPPRATKTLFGPTQKGVSGQNKDLQGSFSKNNTRTRWFPHLAARVFFLVFFHSFFLFVLYFLVGFVGFFCGVGMVSSWFDL